MYAPSIFRVDLRRPPSAVAELGVGTTAFTIPIAFASAV
jgi:hypothetical protein